MENEIKVNDWIRTKAGRIHKVDKIIPVYENGKLLYEQQFLCWDGKISGYRIWQLEDIIVKHSPNIIDLIEERRLCEWAQNNTSRTPCIKKEVRSRSSRYKG